MHGQEEDFGIFWDIILSSVQSINYPAKTWLPEITMFPVGPLEDRTIDKSGILALSKTVLQAHKFWNQQFAREEADRDGESKREREREGGREGVRVRERESLWPKLQTHETVPKFET